MPHFDRSILPAAHPATGSAAFPRTTQRDAALHKAARELEANFLAEMLKSAGLGKSRKEFGGGVGEDQFGSFLRQAQAREMVKSGGIGLAESLYEALKERADGT